MRLRLNKSESTILAISLIVLFFVSGVWLVNRNSQRTGAATAPLTREAVTPSSNDKLRSPAQPEQQIDMASGFVLQNFQRSEVKDGRKLWEVKAKEGLYDPAQSTFTLTEATLWVYRTAEDSVKLDAEHAVLLVNGSDLKSADISGKVKVLRNDGTTVETEHAVYDRVKNSVVAPGAVRLRSNRITITGNNLTVNVETKEMKLGSNVTTTIKPHGEIQQ